MRAIIDLEVINWNREFVYELKGHPVTESTEV